MEYALGDICKDRSDKESICLNPCCNGICSRRLFNQINFKRMEVLILVVMEYALGVGHSDSLGGEPTVS